MRTLFLSFVFLLGIVILGASIGSLSQVEGCVVCFTKGTVEVCKHYPPDECKRFNPPKAQFTTCKGQKGI
jgi:hypothetical protein